MSATFWLLIMSVAVPSVIAVISLAKESQEKKDEHPRRWHWHTRLVLSLIGLVVGLVLAIRGETSKLKSESTHRTERESDKQQITKLQQSVEIQIQNNDKQYERHQTELHNLQDQLIDLKKDIATEDLRKKMGILQGQLDKALADKPKAKLETSFFLEDDTGDPILHERYVPVENNIAKFDFTIENHSPVFAKDIGLWIRICDACKFHSEPKNFVHVAGARESERLFRGFDLPPGARYEKLTAEIEVAPGYDKAAVGTQYRCVDCVIEDWQQLILLLGRRRPPDFSQPPAPITKTKPKKPEKF